MKSLLVTVIELLFWGCWWRLARNQARDDVAVGRGAKLNLVLVLTNSSSPLLVIAYFVLKYFARDEYLFALLPG